MIYLMVQIATLFLVMVALGAVGWLALQRRRELEVTQAAALPEPPPLPRGPELPAFVDASDPASMDAWNKAQTELDL